MKVTEREDDGREPVLLQMKLVPPHLFAFNMPEELLIFAESITDAYIQVVKFFGKLCVEFSG